MTTEGPGTGAALRVGLVQFAMCDDPARNLERALDGVAEAARRGAAVVCLPELFRTPYFCVRERPDRDWSETLEGGLGAALSSAARTSGVVIVGGSFYEDAGDKKFNTSPVFDADGSLAGIYRKTHIPHDPCFFEQNYFAPGDSGFKVFDTAAGRVAVLICYDQWFPEAARAVALLGADVIFYPTAIATVEGAPQEEGPWQRAWENVQRGHAVANAVPVAAVNRVGREGDSLFWGGSFVCDAFGTTLASAGDEAGVTMAEIDRSHAGRVREGWRFFHNRRPDAYGVVCDPARTGKADPRA